MIDFRAFKLGACWLAAISVGLAHTANSWAQSPHWLWHTADQPANAALVRRFDLAEAVHFASLKFAADFCGATVELNGEKVLTVDSYTPTQELEATRWLRRGANELRVLPRKVEGPSAIALSLTMLDAEGRRTSLVSDRSWMGTDDLGEVRPELWGIGRRAATVSVLENYEQWQQTKSGAPAKQPKLWSAPGFEITALRVAGPDEGSWISLAFDAQGRAIISREDRGLLRMTLSEDRKTVSRVEPIDVDVKEVRGMLYVDEWLYANANSSKAMYRLKLNEDGRAEDVRVLREFPGEPGHGRNDLALGPEGDIYSIHGDAVNFPKEKFSDRTSPLRESRRSTPRKEGYLVHVDREGKRWEVVCTGLRNPYGIAFSPNGDLFTYDADNEFDMGTPWYRPTRIVQLVSGADYGYRINSGRWPVEVPDHPDNGLPTIDVGRGSPTSLMFGANLKFPSPYRESLLILDWTYGRVLAMHMAPRGAGYRANLELFLQGQPLNVTDLAAGPDGALYLTTGGRKTQSTLYRVAYVGSAWPSPFGGLHELHASEYSQRQRALRTKLEQFHGNLDAQAVATAWPHLESADPSIRHAARIAVEQQPLDEWRDRARASHDASHLAAWMALARTGDAKLSADLVELLLRLKPDSLDLGDQFALVHLYQLCWERSPDAVKSHRAEVVRQLVSIWPDDESRGMWASGFGNSVVLRRRLALLLADVGDPGIVERVATTLLVSSVQEDQLQGLLALRNQRDGWTEEQRRLYFRTLREGVKFVGGQGMPGFLDKLRTEALTTLSDEQKSSLADVLAPLPSESDEPLPAVRPTVRKWTIDDLGSLAAESSTSVNIEHGAKIFREALCGRCHRSGLTGPAVGPDLTYVARRFSRRDMLESMLTPSRVVAENYRNVQVITTSGKAYVGRLLNEGDFRSEKLRMNVNPLQPGEIVEIDKKDIEESHETATSPMPDGLLDSFTQQEIAALLVYLESGMVKPAAVPPGR